LLPSPHLRCDVFALCAAAVVTLLLLCLDSLASEILGKVLACSSHFSVLLLVLLAELSDPGEIARLIWLWGSNSGRR
jgi:hypothetical protein